MVTLVSGAVRRAHPSRTRSGPRLAPRFCRWLACVLSPPLSLSSLRHRAPVWLARSPATPAKWSAPPPSSSCHSPITVTACPLPFPPDSRPGPIPPPPPPPTTTTTNALELGPPLPRPALAWPALPCPEVHQCGPPSGSADPSRPHAHPYLPQIRPSLSHAPGRASPPRPCSCRGPAPAACSLPAFGQVPASPTHPFMLALQEDSTQAPLGLPASPSARRRPLSLR